MKEPVYWQTAYARFTRLSFSPSLPLSLFFSLSVPLASRRPPFPSLCLALARVRAPRCGSERDRERERKERDGRSAAQHRCHEREPSQPVSQRSRAKPCVWPVRERKPAVCVRSRSCPSVPTTLDSTRFVSCRLVSPRLFSCPLCFSRQLGEPPCAGPVFLFPFHEQNRSTPRGAHRR